MRATNGFPEILPPSVTSSSWYLFGCLAISSDLPLFINWHLFSTHSVSLLFYFALFFILDLRRRRHFISFLSFCLISTASQHRGSSARTLSKRRNLLIASFPNGRGEYTASFLVEEISGPDHAIDFHAPTVRIFLSVFLTNPSFIAFIRIAGNPNWIFRASIGNALTLRY